MRSHQWLSRKPLHSLMLNPSSHQILSPLLSSIMLLLQFHKSPFSFQLSFLILGLSIISNQCSNPLMKSYIVKTLTLLTVSRILLHYIYFHLKLNLLHLQFKNLVQKLLLQEQCIFVLLNHQGIVFPFKILNKLCRSYKILTHLHSSYQKLQKTKRSFT